MYLDDNLEIEMGKYDLEERTFRFSENLAKSLREIPIDLFNKNAIAQILRSGTSIGAN